MAGSVLYGGAIDNCKLNPDLDSYGSGEVLDMIVHIDNDTDYNVTSIISSKPLQLCICEHIYCYNPEHNFQCTVYPGETFQVFIAQTIPSRVVNIGDQVINPGHLSDSQHLLNNMCTKLNYTALSLSQHVNLELFAEGSPCSGDTITLSLGISVYINQTYLHGFQSCV